MDIDFVINHIRNRSYMDGVDREKLRVKKTGEVFTPTETVQKLMKLDSVDQKLFADAEQVFIDPSGCGDGQFLGEILIRKLENGIDFETALSTIYGVDLMPDNVELCRERLLCGREDLRHIVEKTIIAADSLRYNFRFIKGEHPYDDELKQMKKEEIFKRLFKY